MKAQLSPSQYLQQTMGMILRQFYIGNEKEFYQDQDMLKRSITELESYLHARSIKLPQHRLAEIFQSIITTVKQQGDTGNVRRFSAYLLKCVQSHLQHHGEEYYDEGKRTRDALADVMLGVRPASSKIVDPGDAVIVLAEIHKSLISKGGRKKKACKRSAKAVQLDFLGTAQL